MINSWHILLYQHRHPFSNPKQSGDVPMVDGVGRSFVFERPSGLQQQPLLDVATCYIRYEARVYPFSAPPCLLVDYFSVAQRFSLMSLTQDAFSLERDWRELKMSTRARGTKKALFHGTHKYKRSREMSVRTRHPHCGRQRDHGNIIAFLFAYQAF